MFRLPTHVMTDMISTVTSGLFYSIGDLPLEPAAASD